MERVQRLAQAAWQAVVAHPKIAAATVLAILVALVFTKPPPFVPYWLPVLGSMFAFGVHPVNFLLSNYKKYGEVFTILLFGRRMTYFVTPESLDAFFNARHEDVSAEKAYAPLTVPVFGKDVVYDVPYSVLVEQKKMVKSNLTPEMFRIYVPRIEQEVVDYTKNWGQEGVIDVNDAMAELTILTASSCLMGDEIRKRLSTDVARLYSDLDNGFTPLNFMLPNVPFPANARRDAAQLKLSNLFVSIIKERRAHPEQEHEDMLNTLMNAHYKSGEPLKDHQVANLMIALLMAGQHTSSATLSWLWAQLTAHPEWQYDGGCAPRRHHRAKILEEQVEVQGGKLHALDFDTVDNLKLLESCVKESLRLNPPLVTIMRYVVHDLQYKDMVIPAGSYICASPSATHRLPGVWKNPDQFDPERFTRDTDIHKFAYIPFGAGRHKCIGENFAYLQVKSIVAALNRRFEFELIGQPPKGDYTSMVALPTHYKVRYRRRPAATA